MYWVRKDPADSRQVLTKFLCKKVRKIHSPTSFCRSAGRKHGGSRRRRRWGIGFLLKSPGKGGGGAPGREVPRGREGVCSELGNLGGGGAKYFLWGPKCPPSKEHASPLPNISIRWPRAVAYLPHNSCWGRLFSGFWG